ncbi:transcriptional regulator GcvA [Chitinimonas lacunae]|uniref:Transcriptional regulator GcvA n=1 Tax=Chitinimonas lacunae TaxID=1963018 RepID=A0ABV8MM66_9NEIS
MNSTFEKPVRLPSLVALRAFEATARLGGVARAAAELFVTPSAVSHQIKSLETELGMTLVVRQGRGIVLTADGRRVAAAAGDAFAALSASLAALRRECERPRVVVTAMPSFAARWLTPRLGRFIEAHPEIELRIQTSQTVEHLAAQGMDLAIRMGLGNWPGVHSRPFMNDSLLVAARPDLAGGLPRCPTELTHCTLLGADGEPWPEWLAQTGVSGDSPLREVTYSDSGMVVQAALDGQGVALTRRSLVGDELQRGRLVQLFGQELPLERRYWLVTPEPPPYRPAVAAFIDWLEQEKLQP